MRHLALLSIAIITLSGCAGQVTIDGAPSTQTRSESTCYKTQNGVTRDCDESIRGPRENVTFDERAPMTDGIDLSWSFAVHPGANVTTIRFTIEGHDGGGVSVVQSPGCIKLNGPLTRTAGTCSSGGIAINVNGAIVSAAPRVLIDEAGLPAGDYTLSAKVPRALADYHVVIDVVY